MFGAFERAVAGRYLRARRGERFVSVIAGFSLVGIALGVATLIIVMSVMGGFQVRPVEPDTGLQRDIWACMARACRCGIIEAITSQDGVRVPGVVSAAIPVVDGQVLLSVPRGLNSGRAGTGDHAGGHQAHLPSVAGNIRAGFAGRFSRERTRSRSGIGLAGKFGLSVGDELTLISPQGAATAFGTVPRVRAYKIAAICSRWG